MKSKTLLITLAVIAAAAIAGYFLFPFAFTVAPIAEVEQVKQSEAFDPVAYVNGIWQNQVLPAFTEKAVDLPTVLNALNPGPDGTAPKDSLIPVAKQYGLITVGEAHVYRVKGSGTITAVDTSKSTGTMEVKLDGYDGSIIVKLYIGPRIPSDESSVRDAVGFITFGDFKEQTEYGKVAAELNKRVNAEVLTPLNKDSLVGKQISFLGAMNIRTFNLVSINLKQVNIVPVQIEVK
ncbi:MAG: DUF2291 domain-containing protein [Chloroflexota bacterium]